MRHGYRRPSFHAPRPTRPSYHRRRACEGGCGLVLRGTARLSYVVCAACDWAATAAAGDPDRFGWSLRYRAALRIATTEGEHHVA